jgi:DNA polymerase
MSRPGGSVPGRCALSPMHPFADHIAAAEAAAPGRVFHRVLFLDLETRSRLNLRQIDAYTYANDPSTEIMCARWAVDDGPIEHWDETHPQSLAEVCLHLSDPLVLCCFHNAEFEPKVIAAKLGIEIEVERIVDSAAVARAAGLPGGLDDLAGFFGSGKDRLGRAAMLKLSRPRKPSKKNPDEFWRPDTKPDDFELMYAYCGLDVHEARRAMRYMPAMSPFEVRVYHATYRMNARGFPIDRHLASHLWGHVVRARERLSAETKERHGFTLSQVSEVAEFLGLPSVAKNVLRDYLKNPFLPEASREVAEARLTFAKTSVDKIKAMLARSKIDGRVHDGVIYGAAERTLRFAGAGVQPQNLVRGMGERQSDVFAAVEDGTFELLWGDVILPTIAEVIRGLIAEIGGRPLSVADYSQIEARLLAWIVGDKDLLGAFARGDDPYKMMAAKIYRKAVEEITSAERFMGKQTVLGCGYGLGGFGFAAMLDTVYDVQIPVEEAADIVRAYRRNAPAVVKFWRRLDSALAHASQHVGTEFAVLKGRLSIKFTRADRFWIKLPSGRLLRYYEVKGESTRRGMNWSCFGRLKNGAGYGRVKIYGGALTGHIVQSTARDIMASAMVRLDELGHPLVLTVHDELVEQDDGRYEEFAREMTTRPEWLSEDFPLATDAFQTERYRK